MLRVLGAMNGFHFWNKEKPITRKGFLYMELEWKQRFAMLELLTREVSYMKRIVSTNGYRKEKSNTQVVLALKDTKPRTVVDVRIRQGLKKYNWK